MLPSPRHRLPHNPSSHSHHLRRFTHKHFRPLLKRQRLELELPRRICEQLENVWKLFGALDPPHTVAKGVPDVTGTFWTLEQVSCIGSLVSKDACGFVAIDAVGFFGEVGCDVL